MSNIPYALTAPSLTRASLKPFYTPSASALIAVLLLSLMVLMDMRAHGFTVSGLDIPALIVGAPLFAMIYCRLRNMDPRLISAGGMLSIFYLLLLLATTLQYTMAAHGARELVDQTFLSFDHALGLDPMAFTAFFDQSPVACNVLLVIYSSLNWQMAAIVVFLFFRRDYERFDALVISLVLLIIAGAVIAAILPAIGFTGVFDIHFQNTDVGGGRVGQSHFLALRSGVMRHIDLMDMPGIITFPSGHAALAVLYMLIARAIPYAFWPAVIVNSLMLVGTVVHGGHYFCDIIAGVALTLIIWPLSQKLEAWRPVWRIPLPRALL